MKNNVLVVILSILVVLLAGVALLFFVGHTVSLSVSPLSGQVGESLAIQRDVQSKLKDRSSAAVLVELKVLSEKIDALDKKMSATAGGRIVQKPSGGGAGCGAAAPSDPDANKVYDLKVGETPVMGKKNAPVTITAFMDLQCPFCNRFYPPVKEVVQANPDKVNFVMKNYPLSFHSNALGAAKLAFAANVQGKYYEMVELLLKNSASTTDEKIKEYAQTLGLNYNKLVSDFKNKDAEWVKMIEQDKALAEQVSINGTPTFYINGRKTSARDAEAYKAEIDKIIAAKKK